MSALTLLGLVLLADGPSTEPLSVSIIELVANPERFDGKAVVAVGYIEVRGDEDQALFLNCEDLRNWNAANAVRLEVSGQLRRTIKRGQLVYVSGTFSLRSGRRWSHWPAGQIADIRGVDAVATQRVPNCLTP